MSTPRILLVHADGSVLGLLHSMLQSMGLPLDEADSDRAAVKFLDRGTTGLVIAGIDPGDADALELLLYVRRKQPKVPVILLFTAPHPERAKEATLRGASAVLRFPVSASQIRAAVSQALGVAEADLALLAGRSQTRAAAPAAHVAEANGHGNGNGHHMVPLNEIYAAAAPAPAMPAAPAAAAKDSRSPILGDDPCLRQAIELAETIAPTRAPVLILGEHGCGKSVLARALHQQSLRREGPFVEVSCAHMKESALETELFGRKASFADPLGDRPGKVAMAQEGTLYLDEVAALTPELQFKLLRLIQDGEYEPVGSTQTVRADIRLILASKENLSALVEQGRLRQDLHGRISVVSLKVPPLRHRGDDVAKLAEHFRERFADELDKEVDGFTPEAMAALKAHGWPGNVEELENVVERAAIQCRGTMIEAEVVARAIQESASPRAASPSARPSPSRSIRPLKEALEEPEKRIILQALEALNWNRQETAKMLDINRTTLYKKMKKYGLLFDEPVWVN